MKLHPVKIKILVAQYVHILKSYSTGQILNYRVILQAQFFSSHSKKFNKDKHKNIFDKRPVFTSLVRTIVAQKPDWDR